MKLINFDSALERALAEARRVEAERAEARRVARIAAMHRAAAAGRLVVR